MKSCFFLLLLLGAVVVNHSWGEDADSGGSGGGGGEDAAESDGKGDTPDVPKTRDLRQNAQKFEFQAEVTRLMDIIINSLYSNKDIFLRELISNASDALDKIRFLSLTDKSAVGEGDDAVLDIRISLDKENKCLKIRDKGIGMTKDDLIKNLGTIAKSGTSAFLDKMQQAGDLNLIGQFGVGFYSVYLVADYVEVITKHNDDKQYVWESKADGKFAISEDTEGEPLGRGTQVNIYLKDDTKEYAEENKLEELVRTYSEFINFPIYLYKTKQVEVEDEEEDGDEDEDEDEDEESTEDSEDTEDEDESGVEDGEESSKEKPEKEKKYETVQDWERVNESKALWLRSPSQVSDDEYQSFYSSLSKGMPGNALTWSHFKAEGDVEFRAIIFIPGQAPFQFYDKYYEQDAKSIKLFVRRVFISDDVDELLPRYLRFLLGLVDSDTLPLNVSREMLQQHASLKTIKKKLIRKALDMIKKIAEEEKKELAAEAEEQEEKEDEEKSPEKKPAMKYTQFWNEFGKAMKLGIMEDTNNRNRLSKLLRFYTSKSPDKLASLEEYVSRMKEGQKQIYYLCGQSMEEIKASPFLERLHKKDLEVIYYTESMDEYMMQHLVEFDDRKFQDASKDDLKFGDKDDKEKKGLKKVKEEFKELTKWWKDVIGGNTIASVKVSNRLATSPCVVVTSQYGWSPNMERIMQAQAFQDPSKASYMRGRRTLEINPRHPLIKELKSLFEKDEASESTKNVARLLHESALLESGFTPEDGKGFADRLRILIKEATGMKAELDDIEDEVPVEDDEEEDEEDEAAEEEEIEKFEIPQDLLGGEDLPGHDEL